MAADPYTILGISRSASEKEVKSAYRKLAKELHPDKNVSNPKATERFSEVTRAYDLLSDKDKRARFDRGEIDIDGNPAMGNFGGGGFGGGQGFPGGGFQGENIDLGDILSGMFGGGGRGAGGNPFGGMGGGMGGQQRRPAPRGANVAYRLPVSLPDAATQASQRITLSDGKSLDLKLPAGVEDGTQMRLGGKGESGPGGKGDAIVTISLIPHPFFRRDGDNLRVDLPVSLDEALRGAKVKVPTVEGAVLLTVAPGSSSGKVLRLKGKGWTRKDGSRGDQLVTLHVMLPEADDDLTQRLQGWQDGRNLRDIFGV